MFYCLQIYCLDFKLEFNKKAEDGCQIGPSFLKVCEAKLMAFKYGAKDNVVEKLLKPDLDH